MISEGLSIRVCLKQKKGSAQKEVADQLSVAKQVEPSLHELSRYTSETEVTPQFH